MKQWLTAVLALSCTWALAQTPAPASGTMARIRGTVVSMDTGKLVVKERSGETYTLALASDFAVTEVIPTELSAIQANSFVGTASMTGPDGQSKALEVLVFPEAARGTGEGSYPWDLQPGSTMTNATVADVVAAPEGRTLKLRYKNGEKTVIVPVGTPIVTFKPGDTSLLVPGAKVLINAQLRGDTPTALRALAGRNGFQPPM